MCCLYYYNIVPVVFSLCERIISEESHIMIRQMLRTNLFRVMWLGIFQHRLLDRGLNLSFLNYMYFIVFIMFFYCLQTGRRCVMILTKIQVSVKKMTSITKQTDYCVTYLLLAIKTQAFDFQKIERVVKQWNFTHEYQKQKSINK